MLEFQTQLTSVIGHHFIAVGNHSLKGFFISYWLDVSKSKFGRGLFDAGESKGLQDADVDPAQIKLIRLDR